MTAQLASGELQVSRTPSRQIDRELTPMTSKKTTTADGTTARPTCSFPGCDQLAAPAEKPGRPPEYCAGRGHTRASAWKERRRLNAEKNGTTISAADDASPVTMAKVGGAELPRSLRAEADRISALGKELPERIDVLTDPTAAEAETADAERRVAQADQFRVEADDAAEQMSEELTAAQNRATAAEERAQAAESDQDAAVAKARADADKRIADAQAERDAAIAKAQADADARVRAAEEERDTARKAAAVAEAVTGQRSRRPPALRPPPRPPRRKPSGSAPTPSGLLPRPAPTTPASATSYEPTCARAERAEYQADVYRAELDRLRATSPDPEPIEPPAKPARRGTRG
jgi:hypothetical protein